MMNTLCLNVLSIMCAVLSGICLYWTSQQVQTREARLSGLTTQIEAERDAYQMLNVEWAYLNRPERLERLAGEFFRIEENTVLAMADSADMLPAPLVAIIPPVKPLEMIAAAPKPKAPVRVAQAEKATPAPVVKAVEKPAAAAPAPIEKPTVNNLETILASLTEGF